MERDLFVVRLFSMATGKACGRWGRLCEAVRVNCVLELNLVSFLGSEVGDTMKLVTEPVSQIVEPVHRYTWASIIINIGYH